MRFGFGILLGICVGFAAAAQTDLNPDQAREAAAQLLVAGHAQTASELTQVLIERDPSDVQSLIVHAHALRTMKRYKAAQETARQAWQVAQKDADKYGAARVMAQSLSADGHKTRAQFWLRRAAHVAPTDVARAQAAQDYQFVRKINPWSVKFSFGITPSDNVNNAPRDNTLVLGGLIFTDPTAVPISGFETQVDTTLRYNFSENQNRRNFAALRWTEAHVTFTDDDVPAGLDASNFAYRRVETQIGRDFIAGPGKPRQTASVSFGRLWSGGSTLADEVRLSWRQVYARPANRSFAWTGELGYSDRKDSDIRSGFTGALHGQWLRPLENGNRIGWNASVARTDTDSAALTHTSLSLGANYAFGEPMWGAKAQIAINNQIRRYDDPLYGPDARSDVKTAISGSLLFVDFDTYGFAPKLTVEASKTTSNVNRFETQNFGLNIGFQSLF